MIECKNCRYKGCALCGTDHKIHAATCENYTPATHADRIRAMSDEVLAHFMMRTTDCPCVARANGCCRSDISCQKAWLDWLRQEAVN